MKLAAFASILLALAVALGAFGAHGLEGKISEKALATYQTGNTYHFYHALALFALGLSPLRSRVGVALLTAGIVLFSFNCYLYGLTGVRTFAMIVPLGGVSFIAGWIALALAAWRDQAR